MKIKILQLGLLLLTGLTTLAQDNLKDVQRAAKEGYMEYLNKIPKGQESFYGFKSRNEFASASIGIPYQLYVLNQNFFTDPVLKGTDYLIPSSEYWLPIKIKNEYRVLLTVAKMNGKWQAVNLGSAGMATEMGRLEKKYPSAGGCGMILSANQNQGKSDFFLSSSDKSLKNVKLYPLASARQAMNIKDDFTAPLSLVEALPKIKVLASTK